MEQYNFRKKARIVAIVDLILTSMTLWIPFGLFVLAAGMTAYAYHETTYKEVTKNMEVPSDDKDLGFAAGVLWFFFALVSIIIIIQLVAAVKLINGTQLGKDAVGAGKLCRFWRNLTIMFAVLQVISAFARPGTVLAVCFTWGSIAIRIIAIYIVQKFITETDEAALNTLPSHQGQVPMSVGMAYAYIAPEVAPNGPPQYEEVVKQPLHKQ